MVAVRARTPNPYQRAKLPRRKRQSTNAVNSRQGRVILMRRGGFSNA